MAQNTKQLSKFTNVETSSTSIVGDANSNVSSGVGDKFSTEGLRIFKYDASAPSGSRFTEVPNSSFTMLGDAGDRLYFGSPYRFYGLRASVSSAKSAEQLSFHYNTGPAGTGTFTQSRYMTLRGDFLANQNLKIWESAIGVTSDIAMFSSKLGNSSSIWAVDDNVLDEVPNTGQSLYWCYFENPVGGLTTPATFNNFAYRTSGTDYLGINSTPVFFGNARQEVCNNFTANIWDNGAIPVVADVNITSTNVQKFTKLRSTQNDDLKYRFAFPEGIDTSSDVSIFLVYLANQAINTADIDIDIKITRPGVTLVGAGQSSDFTVTKNLNIPDGLKYYSMDITQALDIQNIQPDDIMNINITRTDSNGGEFYPAQFCCRFALWKAGKFVNAV